MCQTKLCFACIFGGKAVNKLIKMHTNASEELIGDIISDDLCFDGICHGAFELGVAMNDEIWGRVSSVGISGVFSGLSSCGG